MLAGIPPEQFYDLSLREVLDLLDAYNQRQELKQKAQLTIAHKHAQWVAIAFNEPSKLPTLQEQFPTLFADDDDQDVDDTTTTPGTRKLEPWEIQKLQMDAWVSAFNANRRRKGLS